MSRRVLIVGGVAGGASTAARLRRLDEEAEIVVFDRGPHVSFANCGLPYHVGNVITEERKLLVASREMFRDRFNIDVCLEHEAIAIDRARPGRSAFATCAREPSATSATTCWFCRPAPSPVRPEVAGADLPGRLRPAHNPGLAPDPRAGSWSRPCREAVVVGGGFIGLEMAENLLHRGVSVTVVEKLQQVMPPLDPEMAAPLAAHLRDQGVTLRLGEGLSAIEQDGGRLVVVTDRGGRIADRPGHPRDRRAAGGDARPGGRSRHRQARRHRRRRADAHERPGNLRGRRRRRGPRRRPRARRSILPLGRPGQPPGAHRRRGHRGPNRALQRRARDGGGRRRLA